MANNDKGKVAEATNEKDLLCPYCDRAMDTGVKQTIGAVKYQGYLCGLCETIFVPFSRKERGDDE